jgi:hypothetical protein
MEQAAMDALVLLSAFDYCVEDGCESEHPCELCQERPLQALGLLLAAAERKINEEIEEATDRSEPCS